jgi:hypothetical protein
MLSAARALRMSGLPRESEPARESLALAAALVATSKHRAWFLYVFMCPPKKAKLIRNHNSAIARRHLLSFGVTHDHAHQVRTWFDVKT